MRKTFVMTALLVGLSAVAGAASHGPGISLTANDLFDLDHPIEDPLLLLVTLYNGQASSVSTENLQRAEILAAAKSSSGYSEMSPEERQLLDDEYAPVEVPTFSLGSPTRALRDLVRITVTDDPGETVTVAVPPLASTPASTGAVSFDGSSVEMLFFGIDTDALAGLRAGTYTVSAVLDTSSEAGMWRGEIVSPPVTVRLGTRGAGEPTTDRLYAVGLYRWLDREYEASLDLAQRILAPDSASIAGLVLAGDSLDGLGRPEEALQSFSAAFDAYSVHLEEAGGELEPPRYIATRIVQLQEQLGQRIQRSPQ